MAIQNRRGAYSDFDPTKLVPGEYAVVLTGDPDGTGGYAVYMCYAAGVVQRLVSASELTDALDDFTVSWNAVSGKPEFDTTLTVAGAIPDSKVVGDVLATKAPLASPAFTGTPTAPTPSAADNSAKLATTAFVKGTIAPVAASFADRLAMKADINSPAFTGAPSAPTPLSGDNSERLATTAYVRGTLDELSERFTALEDSMSNLEAEIASVESSLVVDIRQIWDSLASKAPIDSPTFTGDAESVTPASGDNSTRIATTAFVTNAVDVLDRQVERSLESLEQSMANAYGALRYIITSATENLADAFNTSISYASGDLVTQSNVLYRCISASTSPGTWRDEDWERVTVDTLIQDVLPEKPVQNGSYMLNCTVAGGSATYSWKARTTYTDDGDGNITIVSGQ